MNLSWRLASLTIIFVLLAEVLIFVPSVARFRLSELQERIDDAALVADALLSTGAQQIDARRADKLLSDARVLNIVIERDDRRELLLTPPQSLAVLDTVDLTKTTPFTAITDLASCLVDADDAVIRVIGFPSQGGDFGIEATIYQKPLCDDILNYGLNILFLSVMISLFAAALLFVTAQRLLVRPIYRFTQSMTSFRPSQNQAELRLIEPNSYVPELYEAESELRDLQERIIAAIAQRKQLAELGQSMAKIQHDLRNMLATAQLVADGLEDSADPKVRASVPRLMRAIHRANTLAEQVLEFGRAGERQPKCEDIWLDALIEDITDTETAIMRNNEIRIHVEIDPNYVESDEEFVSRIIHNLVRNAMQALANTQDAEIQISTHNVGSDIAIRVSDNGPGVSEDIAPHLFEPFHSSNRKGGTGLGLAIVRELTQAIGGTVSYKRSKIGGACFELLLPKKHQNKISKM